jgi:hypothetical protein
MTTGLEIRAQIDTETARGLIQISGGGAVAIVALLPSILKEPAYAAMASPLFFALPFFACGLLLALLHNMPRDASDIAHASGAPHLPSHEPDASQRNQIFLEHRVRRRGDGVGRADAGDCER